MKPYIREASTLVFANNRYIMWAVVTFVLSFTLYSFVLPSTYTGGRVGLVSLRFITPELLLFAFLFSLLLSFIVPFAVYAFKKKQQNQKTSSAVGSFFSSVLPPLLCCSPLLPTLAATVGGFIPFAFGVSGFVQGFTATYETQIFILIVIILIYSLYQHDIIHKTM